MICHRSAGALALVVLCVACGASSPTAPSSLKTSLDLAGTAFSVQSVALARDFMPIQPNAGPDGGGPLTGVVQLRLEHHGSPVDFTLVAKVCEESGTTRYPVTLVAHDYDAENDLQKVPTYWDGHVGAAQIRHIELRLGDGPYLAPGSKAFVVVEVSERGGDKGSFRTAAVTIGRTN